MGHFHPTAASWSSYRPSLPAGTLSAMECSGAVQARFSDAYKALGFDPVCAEIYLHPCTVPRGPLTLDRKVS